MQYLKADTITEVVVGPAVAVGDGFTPVTSLVGSSADEFEIIKHGATTTTTIAGTLAAITGADGYYALDFSATDTNTEGRLTLLINDDSLILPIRHEFMVVNANVFDSLFAAAATDVLDVNVTQWLGTAAATPTVAGVPEVDVTHQGGGAIPAPAVTGVPDVNSTHWADGAIPAQTITGVPEVDLTHVIGNVTVPLTLVRWLGLSAFNGTADSGTTTTLVDAALTQSVNVWPGSLILFVAGALVNQSAVVTVFDPGTDTITFTPAVTTAVTTEDYVLLPGLGQAATDTAAIGVAGAGLTSIPWNAAWDAEVESEVNDALVAQKLDHLVAVADADDPVDGSIMAHVVSATEDWSTFVPSTDSLQALRDRGDAAWITGAGGSPPTTLQNTTIATIPSQTSFTLTAGSADDGAYVGAMAVVEDSATATQKAVGVISAYTGATRDVTLAVDPGVFTMAVGDTIDIIAITPALPAAPADAAAGLPISDAGGLDLDAKLAATNEVTAARMAALTDWIDGGRLDLLQDAILLDTGTTLPDQIGAIGASAGGALNFEAAEDNSGGAVDPGSTVFVGSETNNFTDTDREDGIYHIIADAVNVIDVVYGFSVGGGRTGTEMVFKGFANANNDDLTISVWDHPGAEWETLGTLNGKAGTTNETVTEALLSKHTGTGSEIGKVYIRFNGSGLSGSADLNTDQILIEAVGIGQTVGYALGRVWINTVSGTAGTEDYVNGTADNPSLTLADAVTIAASIGLGDFNISSDSTLTLAADFNNSNLYGVGYTLDFAGFDCAGTHFYHASPVDGIVTSANNADHVDILDSIINDMTVNDSHFTNCSFKGTVTFGSVASNIRLINCRSIIAGATTPIFDFGTGLVNHNMTVADWQNGIEIRNFNVAGGGTDLLSLSGTGQIVIAASCDGGTINLRGQWRVTDNSGGAVTIVYDDVSANIIAALADTSELQTDWVNDGRLDLILDIIAADVVNINGAAMRGTDGANTTTPPTVAEILTTQMTEAYSADGAAPTLAESLHLIIAVLTEFAISGTILTAKKLDGSTAAAIFTLDDDTNPTSLTRTS